MGLVHKMDIDQANKTGLVQTNKMDTNKMDTDHENKLESRQQIITRLNKHIQEAH